MNNPNRLSLLRWILILPASILAFAVVFTLLQYFIPFLIVMSDTISGETVSDKWAKFSIWMFSSFFATFTFVHVGRIVAPFHKNIVAIVLVVILSVLAFLFLILPLLKNGMHFSDYYIVYFIVGLIVGALGAIGSIVDLKRNNL